ncbi:hypothetical protein J3A98_004425 [Pseudomonas sp. BP6]|nr:hypothetical protein [Pseudomonas sp. BP6]MBP2287297.1 hypothetical protein [Pseudomonas sp. BP7]
MLIDGRLVALCERDVGLARQQLELTSEWLMVELTQRLYHETGNGTVIIPLPPEIFVAAFENAFGDRKYGVVRMAPLI